MWAFYSLKNTIRAQPYPSQLTKLMETGQHTPYDSFTRWASFALLVGIRSVGVAYSLDDPVERTHPGPYVIWAVEIQVSRKDP